MDNNFKAWFDRIQEIQAINPDRHPNQETYDKTLIENYVWPYMNFVPVSEAPGGYSQVKLLDVGCAYGSIAIGAKILGYSVTATDFNREYVNEYSLNKMGIDFYEWDLYEEAPFEKSKALYDVVVFTEVLEHLDFNPAIALLHIRDVMRPGGKLILSTPRREDSRNWGSNDLKDVKQHWSHLPWERSAEREDRHYHLYCQAELIELLDVCGFKVTSGAVLWNGLGHGLCAYKAAGDCSMGAAQFYSDYQKENIWNGGTPLTGGDL